MNRRTFLRDAAALAALAATKSSFGQEAAKEAATAEEANTTSISTTAELEPIVLPKPEKEGGKSVLAALWERKTIRNIKADKLPQQMLSNLLWAAFGINRPQGTFGKPGRTAPSASNSQEIDLYVALEEGVYIYDAASHSLKGVVKGDFRSRSGRRGRGTGPVHIFYVVDLNKYDTSDRQPDRSIGDPEVQKSYYYTDTGVIAQNVYLFAASQGLAAWFHNCDKENTAREFKLHSRQRVLFAQTVGYPA